MANAALQPRQTEIGDQHSHAGLVGESVFAGTRSLRNQDHVGALEIPVHDAGGVRGIQTGGHLAGDRQRLDGGHRAGPLETLSEGFPDDQLHGQEHDLVGEQRGPAIHHVRADVESPTDVGVRDPASQSDLAAETLTRLGIAEFFGAQGLQRDRDLEVQILDLVDLARRAAADHAIHAVAPGDQVGRAKQGGTVMVGHATEDHAPLGTKRG